MKILLTGATGFVGRHIKKALIKEKHELVMPTHNEIDFNGNITAEDWRPFLQGVDTVINAVGIIVEAKGQKFSRLHTDTPIALFEACQQAGVKRVIQISALGADDNAFTPYQKTKLTADDFLRDLPLSWFVFRPSLIYGEGGASFKMFKRLASLPIISFPDGAKQQVQPVHISDLVATVLQTLKVGTEPHQTLDIVGPKPMSLAEYIQTIRASLGRKKLSIIPVPMSLTLLTARLMKYLMPIMHPDNMRMLQQGNTADVAPLTRFLGREPLSVEDALNTMKIEEGL